PFLWQKNLRDSSLAVPTSKTLGPAPTNVFCSLSAAGSNLYRQIGESTPTLLTTAVTLLVAITLLIRLSWPIVRAAISLFCQRWRTFLTIGVWLVPIGLIFNGFQYVATDLPPGNMIIDLLGRTPGSYYAVALLMLILQHLASLVVVGPLVIEVYEELERGEKTSLREAWQRTREQLPHLLRSVGSAALIIVVLSITLIGVPIAIWLLIRWIFVAQATMLDASFGKAALDTSSESVRGRWWRVALISVSMLVLAAAPGAIIGLGLLVLGSASVQLTNSISSFIYMVTVPISLLGMTLLYRQRRVEAPAPIPNEGRSRQIEQRNGIACKTRSLSLARRLRFL
ncbi:MAG: hypothetical protein ACR2OU_19310, partial [Thermomicrobiales bacterium]